MTCRSRASALAAKSMISLSTADELQTHPGPQKGVREKARESSGEGREGG